MRRCPLLALNGHARIFASDKRTRGQQRTSRRLFEHLVGAQEDRVRHRDAKRLGGVAIYRQFEFGRLPDRQNVKFPSL
jgi:hypothetical protein